MKIDHPILSALCIYAAEHGPLKLTKEQVLSFRGDNWGAFRLVEDDNGDFTIHIERVSAAEAKEMLASGAVIDYADDELPMNDANIDLSTMPFFGKSSMFTVQPRDDAHGEIGRQVDAAFEQAVRIPRRGMEVRVVRDGTISGGDAYVAEGAGKATHVATVILNGGPHDGQRVVVPLPLKARIARADKPSRTDEINDFERAHSYILADTGRQDDYTKYPPQYNYVGFKSKEQLKKEYGHDEYDAADDWKDS